MQDHRPSTSAEMEVMLGKDETEWNSDPDISISVESLDVIEEPVRYQSESINTIVEKNLSNQQAKATKQEVMKDIYTGHVFKNRRMPEPVKAPVRSQTKKNEVEESEIITAVTAADKSVTTSIDITAVHNVVHDDNLEIEVKE